MFTLHLIPAALVVWAPFSVIAAILSPHQPKAAAVKAIPSKCLDAMAEPPAVPSATTVAVRVSTVVVVVTVRSTAQDLTQTATIASRSRSSRTSSWTSSATEAATSVQTSSAASSTRVVDCDTVCVCDDKSPDFFNCVSNPDCEKCLRPGQGPSRTQRRDRF